MPRRLLVAIVPFVLVLSACPREPVEEEELFTDQALITCVQQHIDSGDDLEADDVSELAHLDCTDLSIEDISGLQAMTGLKTLSLHENDVWDLRPLEGLTQLEELQLGSNNIGDVAPLAGLTNLERLALGSNKVEDLSPLKGLTELRWLNLDDNRIDQDSVSELCDMDELRWLTIDHNDLDDVDDELDCLDDLDELYWDFQGDGGERGDDFGHTPDEMNARGALGVDVADDGAVSFHYDLLGQRHRVLTEYWGAIRAEGSKLILDRPQRQHEVGRVTADGFELCTGDFDVVCSAAVGRKHDSGTNRAPGAASRPPVISLSLSLDGSRMNQPGLELAADEDYEYGEYYNDMERFILPSPNQWDAGTCLFMSNTGAMEILLNQHVDDLDDIVSDGDTDLSERYLMNASDYVPNSAAQYTMTDLVYTYEYNGGALRNVDYPFECTNSSCQMNWDNDMPSDWEDLLVPTEESQRTVMYLDPNLDQYSIWKTGLIGPDVIERIKFELRTKNAPVLLIYNHYLYWHAAIIIGYDDTVETGCGMVTSSVNYFEDEGATSYVNAIEDHMDDLGGCSERGIFYVRDSIYDGEDDGEMYDYGPWEDFYSARVIEHTYNWPLFLGNHTYSMHRR
jgi:hypothetical protein